jgi:hypothetical protein
MQKGSLKTVRVPFDLNSAFWCTTVSNIVLMISPLDTRRGPSVQLSPGGILPAVGWIGPNVNITIFIGFSQRGLNSGGNKGQAGQPRGEFISRSPSFEFDLDFFFAVEKKSWVSYLSPGTDIMIF